MKLRSRVRVRGMGRGRGRGRGKGRGRGRVRGRGMVRHIRTFSGQDIVGVRCFAVTYRETGLWHRTHAWPIPPPHVCQGDRVIIRVRV